MKKTSIILGFVCAFTTSIINPLSFNGGCDIFESYNIYNNGTAFTYNTNIGVKVNVYANYTLNQSSVYVRSRCNDIIIGNATISYVQELVFPYTDPGSGNKMDIVVPISANATSDTLSNSLSQAMNLLQAPGFIGSVFVTNGNHGEIILNTPIDLVPVILGPSQACIFGSNANFSYYRLNCIFNGYTINDFFLNNLSYNWALWLLICLVYGFFFMNLSLEDDISSEYAVESDWTFHPLYSIYTRGSEIYFKQVRNTQYLLFIGSVSFFTALMYIQWVYTTLAMRLIVFPLFGTIFGLIVTAISGYINLIRNRITLRFIEEYKKGENHDQRKDAINKYEKGQFQIKYIYYVVVLLIMANFLIWPIIIIESEHVDTQGFWLVGIIIAVAFDLLVWRVLMVYLARISVLKEFFKLWGYYYDAKMHDEYFAIMGNK